jgi:hypothetical protein
MKLFYNPSGTYLFMSLERDSIAGGCSLTSFSITGVDGKTIGKRCEYSHEKPHIFFQ